MEATVQAKYFQNMYISVTFFRNVLVTVALMLISNVQNKTHYKMCLQLLDVYTHFASVEAYEMKGGTTRVSCIDES